MRAEEFKLLIKAELVKKMTLSFIGEIAFYLSSKVGNDKVIHLIPAIESYLQSYDEQKSRAEHKAALKKIIDGQIEIQGIETIKVPVRNEYNVSKQNRRMDSLARLLALNESDTQCVAVAFVRENIVISFNTSKVNIERIKALLTKKLEIIWSFLHRGIGLSNDNRVDEINDLINEARQQLLAIESHSIMMLPLKQRKREGIDKFMQVALGKMLTAVIAVPDRGGFFEEDRKTLLSGGNIVFLVPNSEVEQELRASFHAEQVIANYILRQSAGADTKVYVGISKLCCVACHDVLNDNPAVGFRGSHGMTFPNVIDAAKMEVIKYNQLTAMSGILYPDDSESEPENDDFKPATRFLHRVRMARAKSDHQANSIFTRAYSLSQMYHVNDAKAAASAPALLHEPQKTENCRI